MGSNEVTIVFLSGGLARAACAHTVFLWLLCQERKPRLDALGLREQCYLSVLTSKIAKIDQKRQHCKQSFRYVIREKANLVNCFEKERCFGSVPARARGRASPTDPGKKAGKSSACAQIWRAWAKSRLKLLPRLTMTRSTRFLLLSFLLKIKSGVICLQL